MIDPNIKAHILKEYTQFNYIWLDDFQNAQAGDVSKVIDVQKQGDSTFLIFNNGNKVNLKTLNEFLQPTQDPIKDSGPVNAKNLRKSIPFDNAGIQYNNKPAQAVTPQKQVQQESAPSVFDMFKHEKRDFKLKLNMSIPDLTFLRMMYKNASNKNDFWDSLGEYVLGEINKKVITDSLKDVIMPPKRPASKKKSETTNEKD